MRKLTSTHMRGWLGSAALLMSLCASTAVQAETKTVAFLGVHLQNDNAGLEPTTGAEKARMAALETSFKEQLAKSGDYAFVPISQSTSAGIAKGQVIGECGGCEIDYGKQAGAKEIAWIRVQKVSNLILNLNVYMASVADKRMTFLHSVDIRGNTDDSWARSLKYLLDNYMFKPGRGADG